MGTFIFKINCVSFHNKTTNKLENRTFTVYIQAGPEEHEQRCLAGAKKNSVSDVIV